MIVLHSELPLRGREAHRPEIGVHGLIIEGGKRGKKRERNTHREKVGGQQTRTIQDFGFIL